MHRVHLSGLPLDALRYGLVRAFHPGAEDVTVERIRSTFEQILGEREGTLAVTFAGDPTLAGSTSLLTIDLVSDEGPFDGTGWVERFDDLRETALELFKPLLIPIEGGKDARIFITISAGKKGLHISDGMCQAVSGQPRVIVDDDWPDM